MEYCFYSAIPIQINRQNSQARRKKTENCRRLKFAENWRITEAEEAEMVEIAENLKKIGEKPEFAEAPL